MLAKRIIPCLDVRNGKVVKGVNFEGVRDVGDPIVLGEKYSNAGADELVFYDITASHEGRGVFLDVVSEVAKNVFIPLCVGGGISTVDDIRNALRAGADKISVNSSAVLNPQIIKDGADIFGSQCIVLGVDCRRVGDKFKIFINGARTETDLELVSWVKHAEELGAGEICLNSIDTDGVKNGFDTEMLNLVCGAVNIPVIASGGCGRLEHFNDVFKQTNASAALAASVFHFDEIEIAHVKVYLKDNGVNVRLA
jgi:cyclase